MARLLIIDDVARAEVRRVLAHAEANHYYPGDATPGDDPRFVAKLGTYRAVFSFTHADGVIYRHLSISVPSEKYPNPIAAFTIAELFGFTGHIENSDDVPEGWLLNVNKAEHCIVIAQIISADIPREAMS
jgi:hypothetical protein